MATQSLLEHKLTESIIGAFYHVYNRLGYGFLEHVYALALERELLKRGHHVEREAVVTVFYEGEPLTTVRLDMVVDRRVVVENKSAAVLPAFAQRQLINYLRASKIEVGLILHFGPAARFHRLVRSNIEPKMSETSPSITATTLSAIEHPSDDSRRMPPGVRR